MSGPNEHDALLNVIKQCRRIVGYISKPQKNTDIPALSAGKLSETDMIELQTCIENYCTLLSVYRSKNNESYEKIVLAPWRVLLESHLIELASNDFAWLLDEKKETIVKPGLAMASNADNYNIYFSRFYQIAVSPIVRTDPADNIGEIANDMRQSLLQLTDKLLPHRSLVLAGALQCYHRRSNKPPFDVSQCIGQVFNAAEKVINENGGSTAGLDGCKQVATALVGSMSNPENMAELFQSPDGISGMVQQIVEPALRNASQS